MKLRYFSQCSPCYSLQIEPYAVYSAQLKLAIVIMGEFDLFTISPNNTKYKWLSFGILSIILFIYIN